jgi:hypothetical protein
LGNTFDEFPVARPRVIHREAPTPEVPDVDGREPPSLRPTRNELTDHGARWQKEMRRCGLDPMGGALAYNSVLDQWIATRMRGWLR